jgi:hypothetical protein
MTKLKILFNQTLMISTAILFGVGVQTFFQYILRGKADFTWPWYTPLSIVLTGLLCALPTTLLLGAEDGGVKRTLIRNLLHFILVGGVVSLCGYLFSWYDNLADYIPILVMYILIYFFVWVSTLWLMKADEKKINAAIEQFRDEE